MQIGKLSFDSGVFLAPMEDVTERPFRRLCRSFGAEMVYTEFISSEALIRSVAKSQGKIRIGEDEHPIGIQLYGNREEALVEAARISEAAGPDVIDINFGCPVKKVAGKGSGSGMLREPDRLVELTAAVVRAVSLPVTVKTRLGWDQSSIVIVDLAHRLEEIGVAALTLHARTRQQMFKGEAAWEWIGKVKEAVSIPVIGNGDVSEPQDVARMRETTGCDAVMIGRAAIGNPWIFSRTMTYLQEGRDPGPPSLAERVEVYERLLSDMVSQKGEHRGIMESRKHLARMLRGFPNIATVRVAALRETTLEGLRERLDPLRTTDGLREACA